MFITTRAISYRPNLLTSPQLEAGLPMYVDPSLCNSSEVGHTLCARRVDYTINHQFAHQRSRTQFSAFPELVVCDISEGGRSGINTPEVLLGTTYQ